MKERFQNRNCKGKKIRKERLWKKDCEKKFVKERFKKYYKRKIIKHRL